MKILSTVDPTSWTPPAITCTICGTKFKGDLNEFKKSFSYPSEYDRNPRPLWLPYKFDWLAINCPVCNVFCVVENVPSPVTELWLSIKIKEIELDMKIHPENYRYY